MTARTAIESRLIDTLVGAVEALVDAKIAYERRRIADPEWAHLHDVDETRESVREAIASLVAGAADD